MARKFFYTITVLTILCMAMFPYVQTVEAASSTKPVVLKFAFFGSPTMKPPRADVWPPLVKEMEEKSGGRLKIDFYDAQSLGKITEQWNMVNVGICDMTWIGSGAYKGVFPLTTVGELPLVFPSAEIGSKIIFDLYKKGFLDKEWENVKVLSFMVNSPAVIASTKPIRTFEDFKGMKIKSAGSFSHEILQALGATPVSVRGSEQYQALQTGLLDGAMIGVSVMGAWKLEEVCKYITMVKLGSSTLPILINKKKFESLPKDLQMVMEEVWGKESALNGKAHDMADLSYLEKYNKAGSPEIIEFSKDDLLKVQKAMGRTYAQFIENCAEKGFENEGKRVLDELKKRLIENNLEVPF